MEQENNNKCQCDQFSTLPTKIVAYHIASGTPERISEQMRHYLKDGWEPYYGPIFDGKQVLQALVKWE